MNANRKETESAKGAQNTNESVRPEPGAELDRLSHEVIGAAIEVHRLLGPGLLKSVYEEALCVELKAVEVLTDVHKTQVISYLRMTGHRLALLINFNVSRLRDGIKRIICT